MSLYVILFLLIAILYSSVGFGGGSGYLAILSLSSLPHEELRFVALICNITVVCVNLINHIKAGHVEWKPFLGLVALSIPLAFVGGSISLEPHVFYALLGSVLLLSGVIMLYRSSNIRPNGDASIGHNLIVGGGIGFLSGLVGIGGGIFLSPYLHLKKWNTELKIAAASSMFILVNSLSGILGQVYDHGFPVETIRYLPIYIGMVALGSYIGNMTNRKLFKPGWIKGLTAVLVIFAGVRLLLRVI